MLQKNEQYEIEITSLTSEGMGVGRVDNFTLFIEGGVVGDVLRIVVIKLKKSYGYGKILQIVKASTQRATPPCPYFKQCGGCSLQHMTYDAQLIFKQEKVANDLKRIGGIQTTVLPTIGMEIPYHYRNKAQFPVRKGATGKIEMGFFKQRSHQIVCLKDCMIQQKVNVEILSIIEKFMESNHIKPYNEEKNNGLVRHILTRVGFDSKEIMVCLIINGDKIPKVEQLIAELTQIPGMKSITMNIHKEKSNVILGKQSTTLWGNDFISDRLGQVEFQISPASFYQVNPVQTEVLYQKVLEFGDFQGHEIVFDAYCGIGTIALFVAPKVQQVYGIENVPEAIEDAKKNALLNQQNNVSFVVGNAEEEIPYLIKEKNTCPDVVIVDPPRKGCEPILLQTIIESHVKKIIYVSCDSATLARDLKILCSDADNPYEVVTVQPVDCFCQTVHVETVVLLKAIEIK